MNKIIIALDFSTEKEIFDFLNKFNEPLYIKLGMELIYAFGLEIVEKIKKLGHDIFLDLKLHDIPSIVRKAMKNLAKLDIQLINIHCSGGKQMMEAAVAGLKEGSVNKKLPLCIGVTQLTSTSKEIMNNEILIPGEVDDVVISYAKLAKEAGLDGVVCSVHEVKKIYEICGDDFLTVTPGIRLGDDLINEQHRIATPELAKNNKCSHIVVGRSITNNKQPQEVYKKIKKVMEE